MHVSYLIRYNHTVRELYLDAFAKLHWDEVTANKGLSFDSMRNVFLHLTLVEDRWINYIIPGRFKEWADPDFDVYYDVDSLKRYADAVRARTEAYLANLSTEELGKQIVVPWGDKPYAELSVEVCLCHMVLENMIHYGELSAALWQMGLEAPYMAFWRFKHAHP